MDNLDDLARAGDIRALRRALDGQHDAAVTDRLVRLDRVTRAVVFRALPKQQALTVFEDLDPALQRELLDGLREDATLELVAGLDPDDRAGLLDELPAKVARKLLSGLSADEREMTTALLGYPPNSAGRRMTPEVLAVPKSAVVGEALALIRSRGVDAETVYLLAVTGDGRRVDGVVSLRRLLFTPDETPVAQVMSKPVVVQATEKQEVAARTMRDHGLLALPIVDGEQRLLGMLTVDDAMRILEEEASEDLARTGASEPLRRPYLTTSVFGLVRSRVAWLLVLIIAATLTVNVLGYFEDVLQEVVTLALFVPLLIGTGGNAGAQAATTIVRAMAVGDVRSGDLLRVVGREVLTGLLLGTTLALLGFIPAALLVGVEIAIVLCSALIVVCTAATTVGSLTPMVAKRFGVDPAVVSAPFITTFVDATGLIVYFLIARAVLGL